MAFTTLATRRGLLEVHAPDLVRRIFNTVLSCNKAL